MREISHLPSSSRLGLINKCEDLPVVMLYVSRAVTKQNARASCFIIVLMTVNNFYRVAKENFQTQKHRLSGAQLEGGGGGG